MKVGDSVCAGEQLEPSVPDPGVFDALKDFWMMFLRSRSLCGWMPESVIGGQSFQPGPFYQSSTLYQAIVFKEPVTSEVQAAHNRIASWTNENFVIRLWAILESHGFTKPIRDDAAYATEVKLLKRLRQHFAHGSGVFDPANKDHRKLRRDTLRLFPEVGDSYAIPLSVDAVLRPLLQRCYWYAEDVVAGVAQTPVQHAHPADSAP